MSSSSSYASSCSAPCHLSATAAVSSPSDQIGDPRITASTSATSTTRIFHDEDDTTTSARSITIPTSSIRSSSSHHGREKRRSGLFLAGLIGMLSLATLLAVIFVPRDEHSPRMMLHPLSSIKLARPQTVDSVRYLTFGSSSTWGEGLEEPQQQAYPWLLSPSVHNVAARVGGLSLSAICTQSIVGDGVYDVIVIEFNDQDADSVVQLATRVRQRFPHASLVFVRLWSPATHIVYHNDNGDDDGSGNHNVGVVGWWAQQHAKSQQQIASPETAANDESTTSSPAILNSFEFQSAVLNSDPLRWSFVDYSQQAASVDEAVADVEGYLFNLPFPNRRTQIPFVLTSPDYMSLFQTDQPTLLSEEGHQSVVLGIQRLLKEEHLLERPNRHQVGSWGSGDACSLWYATGDYSTLRSRRRASLVDFSREHGVHKHAVEISRRGGSIDVTNPFDEPRMLYLTYMTAAAASAATANHQHSTDNNINSGGIREYPRTKISLGGKAKLLIDPIHDKKGSDEHLTRTTAVGLVPPGRRTVVRLDSLDASSTSRFRLVGLHFLNQGKVPIAFEFDLEPDSAHR